MILVGNHTHSQNWLYTELEAPTANSEQRLVKVPEGGAEHGGRRAVPREGRQSLEQLLSQMNLFTIELNKEEGKTLGMVIVSGKVRSGDSAVMEGVFVEDIVPGSLAHMDGRIKSGDLLVEINDQQMVGHSLDEATQKLRASTSNIKLRIGRPDIDTSVTGDDKDGEEPIYVNELADPAQRELFIKLEKAEIRIAELEGEKEKAEHSLKVFTEEAEEDKKEIQKQMEELRKEFERYKSESQQNMTNLTQALATITMDKGKNDKELEQLRKYLNEGGDQGEEIPALRQQLLEAQEAKKLVERSLESSKTKDQEIMILRGKVSELEAQLSQNRRERDAAQNDTQQLKTRLSTALEKVSTLDTRNQGLSYQLKQLNAQKAQQASRKTAEVEKSGELSSGQQELRQSRAEQERLSTQVAELRMALEREETRRAWLEESLQSQKKSEKSNTADLLRKLQLQAKQIVELKDELEKHLTPFPAVGEDLEEEDEEEIGPTMMEVLDDSDRHLEKEEELVKAAPKSSNKTGQMEPTRQPHPQRYGAAVLHNGVHLPESKPKPPKPYERPKPKLFEKPKFSISEKPEPSDRKALEENLSEPQRESSAEQQGDEDISSATELDAVQSAQRLDSSTVLHKSEMGAQLKRKKPSREYIRSMGSMTDILEGLSVENLTEADETKESEDERVPDGNRAPVEKPKVVSWKESPTNEANEQKRPTPMPRAAPRHKPAVPKSETSSTGMPEAGRRPQAAPRHKREHSGTQNHESEIKASPSHQKIPERPPRPGKSEADMTPSHEHTHESRDSPVINNRSRPSPRHKRELSGTQTQEKMSPNHEPSHSHNHEPESKQSPPHQRVPDRPPKPGKIEEEFASSKRMVEREPMTTSPKQSKSQPLLTKHSPVLQPKPVKEEPEDRGYMVEPPNHPRDIPPPRLVQKHIRQVSKDADGEIRAPEHQDSVAELMGKDPSELSVKEKALLAQKMLEKQKEHPPPSVPWKPYKPMGEQDQGTANFNFENSAVRNRARSFDELDSSPKRMKKILPGAVNIFGSPMRLRSATVATDEPDVRRESIEYSGEHDRYLELPMEPIPRDDTDAPHPEVKVPPKRPPPPLLKKPSDEMPVMFSSPSHQHYDTSTSILDQLSSSEMDISTDSPTDDLTPTNDSNPLLQAAVDDTPSPDPSNLNYDNILGWSPDYVAAWLTKIGLGQHQQIFQDKGILGFMLFDLDGSRLKALGISSHDDRGVLKREVKALRPFADKQKKAMDKKRKEDKKHGKKKK